MIESSSAAAAPTPAMAAAAAPAAASAASAAGGEVQGDPLAPQGPLRPAAAYGRDPRLAGVTESALIAAMQAIMSRRSVGREHPFGEGKWGVYNAGTNEFVVAAIDHIEAERMAHYEAGLRERAGRRTGSPAQRGAAVDPPASGTPQVPGVDVRQSGSPAAGSHVAGPPRDGMEGTATTPAPAQVAIRASNVNEEDGATFATRAELLRHLAASAAIAPVGRTVSPSHLPAGQPGSGPRRLWEASSRSAARPGAASSGPPAVGVTPEAGAPRALVLGAPLGRGDRRRPAPPHKRRRLDDLEDAEAIHAATGASSAAAGGPATTEQRVGLGEIIGAEGGAAWERRGKRPRSVEREVEDCGAKRGRGSEGSTAAADAMPRASGGATLDEPPLLHRRTGDQDGGQQEGTRRGHLPRPPELADRPYTP